MSKVLLDLFFGPLPTLISLMLVYAVYLRKTGGRK